MPSKSVIRIYSRKHGHGCNFLEKGQINIENGQNIWKLEQKCTKFENILKKDLTWKWSKYLKTWTKMYKIWKYFEKGQIIARNKLLENVLIILAVSWRKKSGKDPFLLFLWTFWKHFFIWFILIWLLNDSCIIYV